MNKRTPQIVYDLCAIMDAFERGHSSRQEAKDYIFKNCYKERERLLEKQCTREVCAIIMEQYAEHYGWE